MYSPGKALVVYEMRRHVCNTALALMVFCILACSLRQKGWTGSIDFEMRTYLANSTVTGHDTLCEEGGQLVIGIELNMQLELAKESKPSRIGHRVEPFLL